MRRIRVRVGFPRAPFIALIVAIVGTLPGAFALDRPARAADDTALELVNQAATTTLGTDFTYGARLVNAPSGAALRTTVYERITSRSAFNRTVEQGRLGGVLARVTTDVGSGTANTTVAIPLQGSPTPGPGFNVTQVGVYPVRAELLVDGSPTETSFTTFLVTVREGEPPVREPLAVAAVVPVNDPPAYQADGEPEPAALASRAPGGRLGRLATGLARNAATPLTVVIGGETVQSWDRLARTSPDVAATLTELRAGTTNSLRVPDTFVPIDAPSLIGAGLEATVLDEFVAGFEAGATALEAPLASEIAAPSPVDDNTLGLLEQRNVADLLLAEASLRPLSARLTPARPFLIEGPSRPFRSISLDAGLGQAATPDANGPVATAQRVLAGLSLVAQEAPNIVRGVAFALPDTIDAPAAYYDTLLGGLRTSPYLRAVTATQFLADVPLDATTAGPLVRSLVPPELVPPSVTPEQLERSRSRTEALATLLAPDDPRMVQARNALLVAPTSLWSGPEGQQRAATELTAVDASLAEAGAEIRAPANRTFQLTGSQDRIPLTFVNDSDRDVDVKLRFASSRITFPDGEEQIVTLPAGKSTTVQVDVAPRTSGRYPFVLTMTTTTGDVVLARSTMRVNASAVSNIGLYLAIGAALFLTLWWGHYIWKRRRRHPAPEIVADQVEQPA